MNYYFLIASLPSLSLDDTPPLSIDQFLSVCADHLTPTDQQTLCALLNPEADPDASISHPYLSEWRERETRLRNAVARLRASRLSADVLSALRPCTGFDVYTEKAVADALSRPNPVERELDLDRFRWQLAEELAGFNPFALEVLLAYAIKLNLCWRWARMTPEKGRKLVEKIVTA